MAKKILLASMGVGADGVTRLQDIIVPEVFDPYVQQMTEEKSRLVRTGVLQLSPELNAFLAGGGLTKNVPSFLDLDNDEENYVDDDPSNTSAPKKIGTAREIVTRMNRHQSWSSMNLTAQLAGADPMEAIGARVGAYWARRLQAMFLSTVQGIFSDNAALPDGSEHEQNDMIHDVSGASVSEDTKFSAEHFIDTLSTIGDSEDDLGIIFMHSIVYARAKKQNLIEFIPDARGETTIAFYQGREVVVDDALTTGTAGVYHTYVFGQGAFALGNIAPDTPSEVERIAGAGNGSGQDILHNRVLWSIHPKGHAYQGTPPASGPTNALLEDASSWKRVYAERKMIKMARLTTREA